MIQVIKYKCCGKIFAACCEPECYTDKDWMRDVRKYATLGHKVEMIEKGSGFVIEKCKCKELNGTIELQF